MSPLRAINSGILISIMKCDEVLSPNPEDNSFPYSRSGIFSSSLSGESSSAPSTSGKSTSSSPPMLFIISEKRSKLDISSSESSSQSFQLLKSTLSQLSFALSFVNLGHAWPDSPFRKQHKIDLSVLLCFDSFGSILLKRSISFKCLKLSLPPRQLGRERKKRAFSRKCLMV